MIDLDAHFITKPCSFSLDAVKNSLETVQRTKEFEEQYRQKLFPLYELVGAKEQEGFFYTSSSLEAVSQMFWSVFFENCRKTGRTHILTSTIEDAPTLQMLKKLESLGLTVQFITITPSFQFDLEAFKTLLSPKTALVSMTMVDPLTGVLQPFEEIARLTKENGSELHLDASYAVGKLMISFSELGIDYLSFPASQIHGLKGAALFAKQDKKLDQFSLKAQFDFASFMGLSFAAAQSVLCLDAMSLEVASLRNLFEEEIQKRLSDVQVLFKNELKLPNVSLLLFPKVHFDALSYSLEKRGVRGFVGGNFSQHLHRMLKEAGLSSLEAESAMSFSLSRMTTKEEILTASQIICEEVIKLRAISEDIF